MKRRRNFPPDEDVPSHDSAPKISASDVNRLFINILLVPVQRAFERQYARESNTSHAHACFMRVRFRMPGSQAKLECNVVIIPKILKLYFRAFLFFVLFCFIIIFFFTYFCNFYLCLGVEYESTPFCYLCGCVNSG